MSKLFRQLGSIPNLLSLLRILLIPFFIWTYLSPQGDTLASSAILIASGITDMLDGFIARRFGMITDLGKVLDPVADKLTQFAILVCLVLSYPSFRLLFLVFLIKELLMLIGGILLFRLRIHPGSAKWFGKLATCFFYVSMIAVVLFPGIGPRLVDAVALLNAVLLAFSLAMYIPIFFNLKKGDR